jgi:CIC family chloride channel protein
MLLPAAISAAASYVAFAAIAGTAPILPVRGEPPFSLADLAGAAVVGLLCGIFARAFIVVVTAAKRLAASRRQLPRIIVAASALASSVLIADRLANADLVLGPGYATLRWALMPSHSLALVVAIATLRVLGTGAVIAGGGVGGLFVPLVIQGALVGRVVSGVIGADSRTLLPVVGMAAFLGAGYRVPLAAVVFVAEFTGRPGFVVPGLIAAVVAQLVMGSASVSPYQQADRGYATAGENASDPSPTSTAQPPRTGTGERGRWDGPATSSK